MAGGPVNGASHRIIVPTVLQMASDALNYFTSMTCLYDRYWTASPDVVTLPLCMFHVRKITPTFSNEVSKKRVILYEPQGDGSLSASELGDSMRGGVMQSIVDNVVKNPKTYSVEALVPFQPVGRYISDGVKMLTDIVASMTDPTGSSSLESLFSTALNMARLAGKAGEIAGKLPGMDGVSYINMNSLEAMAESCRTLCMKMWTGYDYKYVVITNLSYDKDPKEDDVFRATFTAQEMPVLSVAAPRAASIKSPTRNKVVKAIGMAQGALISPLVAITGVQKEAGDTKDLLGAVKSTLGI